MQIKLPLKYSEEAAASVRNRLNRKRGSSLLTKKDIPSELTVKIEKLSNLGLGIAKVDGYVIFIPNTCPEDTVKIRICKKNKNYANAEIVEIVEPSVNRTEPFCKMQKVCGACQLQFIDYNSQLKYKKEIVQDAMKSIYGSELEVRDVIPSPITTEYRHKIQYPIGQTKDSKRILAGYYKTGSHELVNIKHCPIQPNYCDKIIDFIRITAQELKITGYDESTGKGELRHVIIRSSYANKKNLVVLVINSEKPSIQIKLLAERIYTDLENINGVSINFNTKKTNLILGNNTEIAIGCDFIEENLCDKTFKVGAKTFFQVNPPSADNIFKYVKGYIQSHFNNPTILDAYAGITAFGICLSDIASKVISIEEVKESVELAQQIINENKISNIELHHGDAGRFLSNETLLGRQFHVTILDPPRKGCTPNSLDYALKLTQEKIIYVSCNPATLARDLKYLKEHGANVEYIQPFDMFPHTYHIESVAIIDISNVQLPEQKLPY